MEVRVLGPLEVRDGDRQLQLGPPKQRALLLALLLRAGQAVPTERLVDDLWSGVPPPGAKASLQSYVSRLRAALGDRDGRLLSTTTGGYRLAIDPALVDATRAEQAYAEARRLLSDGSPAEALALLDEALGRWRGDPLADVRDEPFARAEVARLEQLHLAIAETRIDALLATGEHDRAAQDLTTLVASHPLRERLQAQRLLALYRSGRPSEALASYRDFRERLVDEVGTDPGPELQRLVTAILRQDPSLGSDKHASGPRPAGPSLAAEPTLSPQRSAQPGPLVGRLAETAVLRDALAETVAGRFGVVLLAGDPGIGKTRLLEALALQGEREGAWALWGRCHDGAAPAFGPWVQVIETLSWRVDDSELGGLVGARGHVLAHLVPEVGDRLGIPPPPPPQDLQAARLELHHAVRELLTRASRQQPLVILMDDLHWAGSPSLQLLAHLATELGPTPLLLAGSYRDLPAERSAELDAVLARLTRRAGTRHLALDGLSADEVEPMLAHTLNDATAGRLARVVHERTGGNPFFVIQLAGLLAARPSDPAAVSTVPVGVRHVIRHRYGLLPERTQQLLTVAAVAGRTFDLGVVASATGTGLDEAFTAIEPAWQHRLVEETGEGVTGYRFVHALVGDALLADLPAARIARLHAALGMALEARGRSDDTERLAHHFWHAADVGESERALRYALLAAEEAAARIAYEPAEMHLRRALRLAPDATGDSTAALEVRRRLVELLIRAHGYSAPGLEAAITGDLPEPRPDETPHPLLRHLWFSHWSLHHVGGRFVTAAALADRLLERARAQPDDPVLGAIAHFAAGASRLHLGTDDCLEHFEAALAIVGTHRDLLDVTVGHLGVDIPAYAAVAHAVAGDDITAQRLSAQAVDFADELDRPFTRALALFLGAWSDAVRLDAERTMERAVAGVELCRTLKFRQLGAMTTVLHAWATATLGQPTGQSDRIEQALETLHTTGAYSPETYWLVALADVHRLAGDPLAARAALSRADETRDAHEERGFDGWFARVEHWLDVGVEAS